MTINKLNNQKKRTDKIMLDNLKDFINTNNNINLHTSLNTKYTIAKVSLRTNPALFNNTKIR